MLTVPVERAQQILDDAIDGLARTRPELSARTVLSRRQGRGLALAAGALITLLAVFPVTTARLLVGVVTLMYVAAVGFRILCFRRGSRSGLIEVGDDDARAYPSRLLPRYTVLVPAYREPEVIPDLLASLNGLDYPRDKLEILLLVEEDDRQTLAAIERARPRRQVHVVVVPPSQPQTKPKACNYGLALATGELVTIYDAEDRPDPLQLRKAAIAFTAVPDDVVCLQATLAYYNPTQNRITEWFEAEYLTWFEHFLPGLSGMEVPVPLGGTSNHMRVRALRELGGWDPYNVTEDADLGIRLHRAGLRTMMLHSATLEEANSDFVNWVKQRSRWYKGYLQTWLVHLRHPFRLRREVGWRGFAGFNLFVAGTPLLALLNPLFWALTVIWFAAHPHWLLTLFPAPLYYPAMLCWLVGNFVVIYMGVYAIRLAGRSELLVSSLLVPAYWVMMSIAAAKAAYQLAQTPSFWEKTTHGLTHIGHRRETS